MIRRWLTGISFLTCILNASAQEEPYVLTYVGSEGPGRGKHVVCIAGDEEYRSEEALPMLARILAFHHGFRCTVLFSVDPETGTIDPGNQTNIPGMSALDTADLAIVFLRFRELDDASMKHFVDYVERGRPILGIRTATHAFDYRRNPDSPYARYTHRHATWKGGFGRQILGETWVNHHGGHGRQGTRGIVNTPFSSHPILRGVRDVFGPTDVYTVRNLPDDARVLLWGQVTQSLDPKSEALAGPKNDPMMPLAWVREMAVPNREGVTRRVFTTTFGASVDWVGEDARRLFVNAAYWCLGMDEAITSTSNVDIVGTYDPHAFGFGKHVPHVHPRDLAWPKPNDDGK